MKSLRVKCLFANITLDAVFKICINELISETYNIQNFKRNYLRELLTSATYD